jgi:hypothetical protein
MIFWSAILKVAGGVVAGIAGDEAVKAVVNWRDEAEACEAIGRLFHSTVVDDRGGIQEDWHKGCKQQVADLSFATTQLKLDGLVEGPVYYVEVVNLTLPGSDPSRVRYFGYDSTTFGFWLEKPTSNHALGTPSVWPPVGTKAASTKAIDREHRQAGVTWFDRPLSTGEKVFWGVPVFVPAFAEKMIFDRIQERKLVANLARLLHENCIQGQYQIPQERHRFDVDDLSFWLTPLRTIMSDRAASYYVVVLHNKLSLHPKRVVAFHYRPGSDLRWV